MNGTTAIRAALDMGYGWLTSLMADAKEIPLAFPTSKGGNHPLWVIGHLVHSEASLVSEFILGEKNPYAKWDGLFGMGSKPTADASQYPTMDELLKELQEARKRTLQLLDSYTDADLSRRSHAPAEYADMFGTVGQCLMSLGLHMTFHAGQVADARRAAGRAPVFG